MNRQFSLTHLGLAAALGLLGACSPGAPGDLAPGASLVLLGMALSAWRRRR